MAKGGNRIGKGKPNTAPTLEDTSIIVNENTAFSFSVAAKRKTSSRIYRSTPFDHPKRNNRHRDTSRSRQQTPLYRGMGRYCTGHAGVENLRGEVLMRVLEVNAYTLLELAAFKPLSYVPCNHRPVAERLVPRGLLLRENGRWYPTAVGLAVLGRTLH